MKAILIAGTHSGCGKTTVSLALMSVLSKIGYDVQPFKVGPDFIDTGLHSLATGNRSRNLDLFMCNSDYIRHTFLKHSRDFSVIEGVMGLYDGDYSTYSLAQLLNVPIILVVDVSGMAESVSAVIRGFLQFDTKGLIKAVIFNNVGSERHLKRLLNAPIDTSILGYLTKDSLIEIPKRHLGLKVMEERPLSVQALKRLTDKAGETINLDKLIALSEIPDGNLCDLEQERVLFTSLPEKYKIAIAYDRAFCFYYEDNLDYFRGQGFEVSFFSPIIDETLPDVDFIYIGGGYPELYAKELSENKAMINAIRAWSHAGKPLYAECGGLMYLSKGIYVFDNIFFEMVGVFDIQIKMRQRLSRLGYRRVYVDGDCVLAKRGTELRGHEFHYSEIIYKGDLHNVFKVKDAEGNHVDTEGYLYKNTVASYVHIHFGSALNRVGE